jgi:hypothetical protein
VRPSCLCTVHLTYTKGSPPLILHRHWHLQLLDFVTSLIPLHSSSFIVASQSALACIVPDAGTMFHMGLRAALVPVTPAQIATTQDKAKSYLVGVLVFRTTM